MTLQAGTILIFGIDTPLKTYGLLQTYTIADSVSRAERKAPDGAVVSIQEFNDIKTLTLSYVSLFEGTVPPAIGTTFTFDSLPWQVDNIAEVNVVDGFQTVNITAKHYPQIGV